MTHEQIGLDFGAAPAERAAAEPFFDEMWPHHGRATGYRYGCRCPDCRTAKRTGRPTVRALAPPEWPHHGTDTGYRYGCRCEPCRAAHAEQLEASRRRSGQPRVCRVCDATYVHWPGSGTGTAFCGTDCRAEAARANLNRGRTACAGCGATAWFRKTAVWHLCPACVDRVPAALVDPLRKHRAAVEFVLRVSAHPHCEICGVDVTVKVKNHKGEWRNNVALDHDHACCLGQASCGACLRGLLCLRCNSGIGYFGDDQQRLLAAADYVARHQKGGEDQ